MQWLTGSKSYLLSFRKNLCYFSAEIFIIVFIISFIRVVDFFNVVYRILRN